MALVKRLTSHTIPKPLGATVHLYIGEEAVAVGACAALEKEDYIVSNHRGHGHCITPLF